jgi:exopolysaccharide biosynthesis polyprenyl glycosylphosphotransferase
MQTAWRTTDETDQQQGQRRASTPPLGSVGDISPVWEVLPQGHAEVGPRHGVLVRDARLRRALACSDVVAAFLALYLVLRLIDPRIVHMRATDVLTVPFILLTAKVIGLYDRDQNLMRKTTIDEAPSIFYLAVIYALGVWLCEVYLFKNFLFRPQVLALVALTFVFVTSGRLIVRRLAVMFGPCERCIVIGNAVEAARLADKLHASSSVNSCVVGRVSLLQPFEKDQKLPPGEVPVLGDYAHLGRIVSEHEVERVIIAPRSDGQEQILDAIRLVKALGVKVSVVPRLLEVVGSSSSVDEIDGIWILGVRQFGLQRSSVLLKRAVDLMITGAVLLLLGPLFLILTLAIKLDTRGPVFFKQPRIGERGESFWMLKFRSMVPDAEARKAELIALNEAKGGLFKIDRDPRITRVGRLLRRTSLDELPQLINVLRGDMALVGPRPLVPDEDALIEGWQRRRLAVKPGMTGLWQIFGSARIPMHEMVKIDYIYGANWSLWLDLRILLRTVPYVLSRRGQ